MVIPGPNSGIHVTASFGVAESAGESITELLKLADIAMYQSKNAGRNQVTEDDLVAVLDAT